MKKLLQSLFILIFIAGSAMAQTRTITGTVTDKEDGKPLPGVTVKIKGVAGGTQTGSDGKFALSVPSSATQLEFTYLGYVLQSRPVANVVNVSLSSDATSLAETIIVGYQVQKKETVTGAQTVITGEKLESVPNGNVATTLQGKAPGLQVLGNSGKPGDPPFLRVRGTSSLTAGNSPLILIDGVDAPNLNSVNSADIESVTLLKDPSSTSIYGSRAANGVLLITTKKGKAGEPQFEYSFQYGKKNRVKDNFDLMSTEEKLQYEYDLGYENNEVGNYFARNNFPSTATLFNITPAERATLNDALLAQSHDWKKDLFRDGTVKEHQLGLSGATDKMHYYFNLNRY